MVLRPSWFPEYSPSEQTIFDKIKYIIEEKYLSFWYSHIHTPAVESNKVLLAKSWNETSKQIFWLYGLAQWAEDLKEYSLHFDLTIPFARYILDHEGELTFPFKRYQTQPVRRWERAQRGRFREFRQSDIDTVWRWDIKDSMILYDAEILIVVASIFEDLKKEYPISKVTVHYNDRRFLSQLLDMYPQKTELYSLFDKYYKIGWEEFSKELINIVGEQEAETIQKKLKDPIKNPELLELENCLQKLNTNNLQFAFDPFITRGLDYYTGMVYETFFDDDMALGSVSSGGRYENLTTYIDPKKNFSWVGGSIWISRIVSLLLEKGNSSLDNRTTHLCVNFPDTLEDIAKIANILRNEWKYVELYPVADKLGKQFAYADKKWIPYVVIFGEEEKALRRYKIKDMKTGEEKEITL